MIFFNVQMKNHAPFKGDAIAKLQEEDGVNENIFKNYMTSNIQSREKVS
jgi:hypothetical protein